MIEIGNNSTTESMRQDSATATLWPLELPFDWAASLYSDFLAEKAAELEGIV